MHQPAISAASSLVQPEPGAALLFRSTREKIMKGPFKLSSCLDSQAAEQLGAALKQKRGEPLTIDAAEVSFLGALVLQMLIAACRQWREDGLSFDIAEVSDEFLDGMRLLGVTPDELGLAYNPEVVQ